MKNKKYKRGILGFLFILLLTVPSHNIYARAGGGGGGHSGSHSSHSAGNVSGDNDSDDINWNFIKQHIFLLGSSAILIILGGGTLCIWRLNKYSKWVKYKSDKLKELGSKDSNWNLAYIKSVVEDTFYSIQYAWNDDEYEKVQNLLTKELYNQHIKVLDDLKKENKKNVLEDIKLKKSRIITLFEGNENKCGFIWVEVKFSMIDYIVNMNKTHNRIEGNDTCSQSDFEYWKFIYINNEWVLSKILQREDVGENLRKLYKEAEEANIASNIQKMHCK
ncbi:hypothetical protein QYB59_001608 [Clostridium perfringens]|nr:hypothetical protein [Clostridium perfringens]